MSIRMSILLTSTLLACRSGSVKLDDDNVDTASVSEPTAEPGGEDTGEGSRTGTRISAEEHSCCSH